MKHLSTLPFAGLYPEYDREIESLADHYADQTPDNIPDFLMELAWDSADFSNYCQEYAKEYAESFLQWLSLDGKFESLRSPRYYNFETDRVFVELTRNDIARAWRGVDKEQFAKLCRNRFTSCDGFISSYSPDWRTWGKLSTWDYNQLGTLIQALAETEQSDDWGFWNEVQLMESFNCNGGADNAMWQGEQSDRFWRLFNYMMERANRPVRTLDQWHAARRAENRPFSTTSLGVWVR